MTTKSSESTPVSLESALHSKIIALMEAENEKRLVPNPLYMRYNYTAGNEGTPCGPPDREGLTPAFRRANMSTPADMEGFWRDWYHGPSFVTTFLEMCRERRERIAMAYRPIRAVIRETVPGFDTPMDVTYFEPTKYLTYGHLLDHAENFGKGLLELGEKPGNTVCLFLETRWEWMACAFGVWSQQLVLSTVYANLGVEALEAAFKETECGTIITVRARMTELVDMMKRGAIQRVRLIVVDDLFDAVDLPHSPTSPTAPTFTPDELSQYDIVSWMDVVQKGAESALPVNLPKDSDALALIMYTSGTTGEPKGVMHSYGSLSTGVHVFGSSVENCLAPRQEDDQYVSSLPLAHIFEFAVTSVFLLRGNLVGFGNPRTFADTFARPHGDHKEFKPCFLIGVPRIYDTIKKTAEARLKPHGTLERAIYEHAFATKLRYMKEGFDTPFWNETVFEPLRDVIGGKVRSSLGGGGPIGVPTQNFINVVMFRMQQIWGMTETAGTGNKQLSGDLDTFCLGPPEPSCEQCLASCDGYSIDDKPEPRGEICYRGPALFKGYYKKPHLTKEVIDEDGWLHSGDVGAIAPRGRFRIVGRVKALAKNTLGEYIPVEQLESLYADNPLSAPYGVCVLVHPHRNFITAIVCTDEAKVKAFLKASGKGYRAETMKWPFILEDPEFQAQVNESFRQTAKRAGRGTQEIVKRVCLVPHVWTPDNNVLTAAGKLKRRVIEEKYKETIEKMFVEDR